MSEENTTVEPNALVADMLRNAKDLGGALGTLNDIEFDRLKTALSASVAKRGDSCHCNCPGGGDGAGSGAVN